MYKRLSNTTGLLVVKVSTHAVDIAVEFFFELLVSLAMVAVLVVSGKAELVEQAPMSIVLRCHNLKILLSVVYTILHLCTSVIAHRDMIAT